MTPEEVFCHWLSMSILRFLTNDSKSLFRKLEDVYIKLVVKNAHRLFNETSLNIYIYIYIYIYISYIYLYAALYRVMQILYVVIVRQFSALSMSLNKLCST